MFISPDNKILASGCMDKIKLWRLSDGKLIKTLTQNKANVRSLFISPNSKILVSVGWNKTIKMWGLPNGELINVLDGHNDYINSVLISKNSKMLVSGGYDNTIKLWIFHQEILLRR